jgi:23S rRNA (pseudouridine1915-N3)-methyltransferase
VKLRLLCVGKVGEPFLKAGIAEYAGRIQRYLPLTTIELKEEQGGGREAAEQRLLREREGERLLAKAPPQAFTVVLDEGGKTLDSEGLAALLEKQMLHGAQELTWIIGGPYGLSEAVKRRGDLLLSLSSFTFTHQMVRLFLLEQIYRALTIIRHEPYHNR